MNEPNNFASAWKSYLVNRHIREDIINSLVEQDLISFEQNKVCFKMKNLDWNIVGIQERFITPIILNWKQTKSKVKAGNAVGYFYQSIDFTSPIIITEWEVDWMSIAYLPNVVWLQSVAGLKKLIDWLKGKWVNTIYLLVDQDDVADMAISKLLDIDISFLSGVFDSRPLLWEYKDVNEYISKGNDIMLDNIQLCWKSLSEFISIADSFIIKGNTLKINHDEFAKYLVDRFDIWSYRENFFIYNYWNKKWIRHPLDKQYLKNLIMKQLKANLAHIIRNFKTNDLNNTFDFMSTYANNEQLGEVLNSRNDTEINLYDGILDVNSMKIRDYLKEDYKFHKLPYSRNIFENYSEPTRMLNFLNEILEWHSSPSQIIDFLQEYIWWLFIANTSYEKALLICWSWANGKWVLLWIIKELLGWPTNCSSIWLHEINKDQYLYNLIGKLANIDSDMQQNVQLDSGIIKKLVSGEFISAKSVYKQPIEFKPYSRLLIATNELPFLKTIDNSIRRRFVFLDLKKSFYGKENPKLKIEILEEKNDIFVWAIKWLVRLLNRWCFVVPKELEDELEQFIKENDTVELFLDEWIVEKKEGTKIHNKDLYPLYKLFCNDCWYKPLSPKRFNKRLRDKWFRSDPDDRDTTWRYFLWLCENKPF